MQNLALDLDDRALSIALGGRVLSSAPSAVLDGTDGIAGSHAWQELRLRPRAVSTRHLSTVLTQRGVSARSDALVEAELKSILATRSIENGQRIWIVAPAQAEAAGLAALLGITRRLELPVDGFVDSATVTVAALGSTQSTIVLEFGLHHVAATSVDCDGSQARRRRAVHSDRGGLIELYQLWLDLISSTMVKRTRFDPLHDALSEQQLFESIHGLALEAAESGAVTASVAKGAGRFEAELTRDQFAQAAQPIYRAAIGLVHQLRPAGVPVSIVMPRLVAQLPGMREQIEQFVGCELVALPDGFAAAATSLLDLPEPTADAAAVSLLRRLPIQPQENSADAPDPAAVFRTPLGHRRLSGPPPSHVLWDGRAYPIHTDSLVVGRAQSNNSRAITLPDGLAGVSRRHCTFVHDGEEIVLLDHSTFGTFVNGERVQERVRIYAGDCVRLGEPGVELTLIAVGETNPTALTSAQL